MYKPNETMTTAQNGTFDFEKLSFFLGRGREAAVYKLRRASNGVSKQKQNIDKR